VGDEPAERRAEAEDARAVGPVAAGGLKGRLQRAAAGPSCVFLNASPLRDDRRSSEQRFAPLRLRADRTQV